MRAEPLTRRIWLSRLWQHLRGLVSCRNGSALTRKMPTQHSGAAEAAQAAFLCRAGSLSLPGGCVMETISLSHSGQDLLHRSPLPLRKVASIRRHNNRLLLSCPPSLTAVLNLSSSIKRSYQHPQICLQKLLQDSCERHCGFPLKQFCGTVAGHSSTHCSSRRAALAVLLHWEKCLCETAALTV